MTCHDIGRNITVGPPSLEPLIAMLHHYTTWKFVAQRFIHVSYGRNYLFGEYAITKCGGSPIGYQGFGCSGHQHQNRSMRFTVWDDLICYMIENCRRASQDARVPFDSKYSNVPSFILVTLTIGTYEDMKRRKALSLAHNKDSKPWTLSCGQSLFFPSLVCKNSFNMKEW